MIFNLNDYSVLCYKEAYEGICNFLKYLYRIIFGLNVLPCQSGRTQTSKMEKIYRELDNETLVKGIDLPAFIYNLQYHLVTIKTYEDGIIDFWEEVDFEGFVNKVESGWIVTKLPSGKNVSRINSFHGKSDGLITYIDEENFIKEVRDTLDELQGKATSSTRCREAFFEYSQSPDDTTRKTLKKTYDSVPGHLKKFVLHDRDIKDRAIKSIVEGNKIDDEQLHNWRQRYMTPPKI